MARLRHSLSTLRPLGYPQRTQDSLLAAGRSTRRDWLPAGFRRKVSVMFLTSLPPSPSFLAQAASPFLSFSVCLFFFLFFAFLPLTFDGTSFPPRGLVVIHLGGIP